MAPDTQPAVRIQKTRFVTHVLIYFPLFIDIASCSETTVRLRRIFLQYNDTNSNLNNRDTNKKLKMKL